MNFTEFQLLHEAAKTPKLVDNIFTNDNIKKGIPVKIRTRLEGIVSGVTQDDAFEYDDDNELTINWVSDKDGDTYWAYTNQIVSINDKPYSSYKDEILKLFK